MKNPLWRLLAADTTQLSASQRAKHVYALGQPGTGKSRAIESWCLQDIDAGHGVGVFDVHGDLFQHLLFHLAARPQHWDRVVIVDPANPKWVVGLNPFRSTGRISDERLALFMTDVVTKIWGLHQREAPRLVDLLANSFLALANLDLNLPDIHRFLVDEPYRSRQIPRMSNEHVRRYFEHELPKSAAAVSHWTQPLFNKLRGLLFDPEMRMMFAASPALDMRRVLDERLILLVNLPKGAVGEGASALFGAFLVAQLQKAALSRTDSQTRPPFFLYLDEFQNYTTDNIKDVLSESRKYNLALTLAHQYLDQLPGDLQSAVLNATGTVVSFRIGSADAQRLVKEIFPAPKSTFRPRRTLALERFGSWPLLGVKEEKGGGSWEKAVQELTTLQHREFWVKMRGITHPRRMRTLDMPAPDINSESLAAVAELLDISGARYGRLKRDVRDELAARSAAGTSSPYEQTHEKRQQKTRGRKRPALREKAPPADESSREAE